MKDEIKSFLVQIKGNDEWKEIYNYITNLQEENKRLNNIIDELEKYIKDEYNYYDKYGNAPTGYAMGALNKVSDKLKELKEGK